MNLLIASKRIVKVCQHQLRSADAAGLIREESEGSEVQPKVWKQINYESFQGLKNQEIDLRLSEHDFEYVTSK